jgi:hypothetical protein
VTDEGASSNSTAFESCSKPFPVLAVCSFSDGKRVGDSFGRAAGDEVGPPVGLLNIALEEPLGDDDGTPLGEALGDGLGPVLG